VPNGEEWEEVEAFEFFRSFEDSLIETTVGGAEAIAALSGEELSWRPEVFVDYEEAREYALDLWAATKGIVDIIIAEDPETGEWRVAVLY
jgi:hypothetical protein